MLALIYLLLAVVLGDQLCRRFWFMRSPAHRWASAFLVGILISTWLTYLFGLAFAWSARPLIWANVLYCIVAGFSVLELGRRSRNRHRLSITKWDGRDAWFIFAFAAIAFWLMFGTLSLRGGDVRLASVVWNDFGPNLALMQSFALGHNFPTEYPYFIGEPIRYHFLFWFAAGNLEFLGLSLAWALNLLSVLSMLALLVSIITLGEALFGSRLIGAIAASLLFFQGSLSYVPFLRSQHGIDGAISAILHLRHWLSSGYPYKGEDWGIWSISILYVQRHLLGAVGIFCLVLTFVIDCYKEKFGLGDRFHPKEKSPVCEKSLINSQVLEQSDELSPWQGFVFSGTLIGLLPLWNSPIFVSALALIGCLMIFFPYRARIAMLLVVAVLIGLPQVLYLRVAQTTQRFSILHWGYTVENPTLPRVISYFLFSFGPKLALGLVALLLLTKSHRLLFLAMSSLVALAFATQLSVDIMNNQKFLYVWLILLNLFVAYALGCVCRIRCIGKIGAIILAAIIMAGGFIEMFRVHNDTWVDIPFRENALSKWLWQNTKPTDVFLTDRFVHHPILMIGRRIFYGWPYFAWSMGYRTTERDALYQRMLEEQNANELVSLLKNNGIDYVGIDNGLRQGELSVGMHEAVFAMHCAKVFEDKENRFGELTIYQVPR
jgi:hypothetical protein